jgi:hypothetical protein
MVKHRTNLLLRDSGEQINKINQEDSVYQVLKQSRNRDPGAAEHPGTTDPLRIPLHCGGCPLLNTSRWRLSSRANPNGFPKVISARYRFARLRLDGVALGLLEGGFMGLAQIADASRVGAAPARPLFFADGVFGPGDAANRDGLTLPAAKAKDADRSVRSANPTAALRCINPGVDRLTRSSEGRTDLASAAAAFGLSATPC